MALRFLNSGYFAGKVGIGTDIPDAKLDVRSDSRTAPVVLKLGNGIISGDNGVIVSQIRSYINNSNTAADELARIQVENGSGSHDDGNLSFWTRDGLNNVDAAKQLQINGKGVVELKKSGTAALPVLVLGEDVDTGFFRPSSNNIALSTTGVERVRVSSGGNVGIGDPGPAVKLQVSTNSPANNVAALIGDGWVNNSDYHKEGGLLLVSGTSQDATQTGAGIAFQTRNTANTNYWKSSMIMDRDGAIRFTLGGAGTVAGSEDFTILSGGYVGIGTDSPTRKLSIEGTAYLRDNLAITVTDPGTNLSKDSEIYLQSKGNQSGTVRSSQWHLQTESDSVWGNSGFSISKGYDGGSAVEYVRINSGGNVGINTTSPDFKLDVDGTFGVSDLPFNSSSVSVLVADETIGTELITNGEFATATDWTLQNAGSTISGGKLNQVSVPNGQNVYQTTGIVVGNTYKVVMTISGYSSGGVRALLGSTGATATISANGTFLVEGIAAGNTTFYIQAIGTTTLSVDNVSVKQVTSASNQIQKRELGTGAFGPTPVGAYLPLAGGTMTGDLRFQDNVKILMGAGDMFQIKHTGTLSQIATYEGDLFVDNNAADKDIIFRSDDGSGGLAAYLQLDGSHTQSIAWKDIHFVDGIKAKFGDYASPDLQIYHDGSNSYITDSGTGDLIITADNDLTFKDGSGNIMANMNASNSVELMFGNVKKFETTSTGVTVTGDIKIDSALLSNQENTDVDTGAEVVAQVSTSTYTAAFFDFVIKKVGNIRSGTVYACHDGTNVEFTETSTQDLGDTSDVTLSVDISGANMRLLATVTSDDWSVKSLIRAI